MSILNIISLKNGVLMILQQVEVRGDRRNTSKLLTFKIFYLFYTFFSLVVSLSAQSCPTELVAQSCPTLCDPVDSCQPGSSVHGILQAKILSGLPFPSPGNLPDPGIEPGSPTLQTDSLSSEPPEKPNYITRKK